jgi:hypothetical protein
VAQNAQMVEALLKAGADPNRVAGDGAILDLAEEYGRADVVAILRAHKAKHAAELCDPHRDS